MDNNTAYAYNLDDQYTSIYVNLTGYEQIIFYWSLKNNKQKRNPKWRSTKESIDEGMKIVSYNKSGCVVYINNRRAEFSWYEYDRNITKNDRGPNHKAKLVNFGDWEYDPDFKPTSLTSSGNQYSGYCNGQYSQPQEYEGD
jgi:hypothetical protein